MTQSPRVVAVRIVQSVLQGHSLTAALEQYLTQLPTTAQPFVKALCYGVIRHYAYLRCVLDPLLQKPLKDKDQDVYLLLLIGVHELQEARTAQYAVVSETVNAAQGLKKTWAKGMVNAVLRNFLRQQAALQQACEQEPAVRFSHPQWLLAALQQDWPLHWQHILQANNELPPMVLRVNVGKTSPGAYLGLLAEQGIAAGLQGGTTAGIRLGSPVEVSKLPGFAQGWCSVQDGAAQLAAPLLDLQPGQRVLDACAAPGGKTCHIAEWEPGLHTLLAVDADAERLKRLSDNLQRLSLKAQIRVADFADPSAWQAQPQFNRILLDAPCSGTGVIRRHPDIKLLRNKDDIVALSQLQHTMLANAWSLLGGGGRLVYATCSILKVENEQQVSQFLSAHKDARLTEEIRILPGDLGRDGFYYACLEKE